MRAGQQAIWLPLLVAAQSALAADFAGSGVLRAEREVTARSEKLLQRWNAATSQEVKQLGGRSASVVEVRAGSERFIVRQPKRVLNNDKEVRGLTQCLRVNRAQQILAAKLEEPAMVPAAVRATVPATSTNLSPLQPDLEVMVMQHAGKAKSANEAPYEWIRAVSEHQRLAAAVVDLFSEQRDRKMENILVRRDGRIRLIDPDKSFGQQQGAIYRSEFFAGGVLGYETTQATFANLPQPMRETIGAVAQSSLVALAETFGLLKPEAQRMRSHARRVRKIGLTAAIDEYVATLGPLHPPR